MYRVLVNLCLIALHMSSNSAGASPLDYDGESLFDSSKLLTFHMPASCDGKNFCFDKNDDYPETEVEKMLDQWPLEMFGERIGTENGFDCDSECETESSDQPIYYIRDEFDEVRAVVQSPGKFDQIYGTRWCKRPGRISYDTNHIFKGTWTNKNVTCVNTHMDYDFYVLSSEGKLQTARAKGGIPVCCKCVYQELNRTEK
ncbi:hypothetical protein PYW08_001800 [Mythimna loreyi]|uniref:Uncharacterized protein n=1 Tax=Mythimna loreyi TaxID=667449 RepID=A0ACC2R516_9NEOP|nr:hypothetical protein PYW08_001800 [Mythimna loreyi]